MSPRPSLHCRDDHFDLCCASLAALGVSGLVPIPGAALLHFVEPLRSPRSCPESVNRHSWPHPHLGLYLITPPDPCGDPSLLVTRLVDVPVI